MPRPDRSRSALVATAATLFRRQGYAATGLSQLLTESGATTGSLYHHFPEGKEQLAEAAIDAVGAQVAASLKAILGAGPASGTVASASTGAASDGTASTGTPSTGTASAGTASTGTASTGTDSGDAASGGVAKAVERWTHGLAAALAADPRDGCPVAPLALESIHVSERLRAAAARAFESWRALLADRLRRDGWTVAAADRDATAVIALIEGALLLSRTAGDPAPLRIAASTARRLLSSPAP